MTSQDAVESQAACDSATPGPWNVLWICAECDAIRLHESDKPCPFCGIGPMIFHTRSIFDNDHDWDFIRLSRTALPAALADREEMLTLLRRIEDRMFCVMCGNDTIGSNHRGDCPLANLMRRTG